MSAKAAPVAPPAANDVVMFLPSAALSAMVLPAARVAVTPVAALFAWIAAIVVATLAAPIPAVVRARLMAVPLRVRTAVPFAGFYTRHRIEPPGRLRSTQAPGNQR